MEDKETVPQDEKSSCTTSTTDIIAVSNMLIKNLYRLLGPYMPRETSLFLCTAVIEELLCSLSLEVL